VNFETDVLVVGAGPAGASAARVLAGAGHRVWMFDAREVPRHKVCGEFLSPDARSHLSALGLLETVERSSPESILSGGLRFAFGRPIDFALPAPALGLSRYRFDALLVDGAKSAGVVFYPGSSVRTIEGSLEEGFQILVAGGRASIRARAVVGAWGRGRPPTGAERCSRARGPRFFAWKRHFAGSSPHLARSVRLYFFEGGYCGLSPIEAGIVNFAGVVRDDIFRRSGGRFAPFLERLTEAHTPLREDLAPLTPAGELATAGPIRFSSIPPPPQDVLVVGDAAGAIDLFSGDGQAQALGSGLLAACSLDAFLTGDADAERTRQDFASSWKRKFRATMRRAALLRPLLLRPWLGQPISRAGRALIPRIFLSTRGPIAPACPGARSVESHLSQFTEKASQAARPVVCTQRKDTGGSFEQ
jgi:flavin-dependent dehydrogenase